jgi:hypothetical protein
MNKDAITAQQIESIILLIRNRKVILDMHLAELYGVDTRSLIQAVKRNKERFPPDFMIQLNNQEVANLRSQNVISRSHGGQRHRPYAFTEQGVAMHSGVLKSKRAVRVNIQIMRTFVRLREILSSHEKLAAKLDTLERRYDAQFKVVFDAIRELMSEEPTTTRRIGFRGEAVTRGGGR